MKSLFVLKVHFYPDQCLRRKSLAVTKVGSAERLLIKSMIATMIHHKGIGLAAPQLGINQRFFVADIGQGPTAFFNPQILQRQGSATLEEGCLSIPGVNIKIKRSGKIVVSYLDINNELQEQTFEGLMARVIQHENDHLDGKLILDYLNAQEKSKIEKQLLQTTENRPQTRDQRPETTDYRPQTKDKR